MSHGFRHVGYGCATPDKNCTNLHELLLGIILDEDGGVKKTARISNSSAAVAMHWDATQELSDSPSLLLNTRISLESIRLAQGYQELGVAHMTHSSEPLDVPGLIRNLAAAPDAQPTSNHDPSDPPSYSSSFSMHGSSTMPQIIDQVKAGVSARGPVLEEQNAQKPQDGSKGPRVLLCRVPVWSESPDRLLQPSCDPIWTWVKTASQPGYRSSGSYMTDLGAAIKDGEYGAGKGFRVVVCGYPKEGEE